MHLVLSLNLRELRRQLSELLLEPSVIISTAKALSYGLSDLGIAVLLRLIIVD